MKKQMMILFGFVLLAVAAYFVIPHSAQQAASVQTQYPYVNAQRIQTEMNGAPTYHGLSYRETQESMDALIAKQATKKNDNRMPANTTPEPAKESK